MPLTKWPEVDMWQETESSPHSEITNCGIQHMTKVTSGKWGRHELHIFGPIKVCVQHIHTIYIYQFATKTGPFVILESWL